MIAQHNFKEFEHLPTTVTKPFVSSNSAADHIHTNVKHTLLVIEKDLPQIWVSNLKKNSNRSYMKDMANEEAHNTHLLITHICKIINL